MFSLALCTKCWLNWIILFILSGAVRVIQSILKYERILKEKHLQNDLSTNSLSHFQLLVHKPAGSGFLKCFLDPSSVCKILQSEPGSPVDLLTHSSIFQEPSVLTTQVSEPAGHILRLCFLPGLLPRGMPSFSTPSPVEVLLHLSGHGLSLSPSRKTLQLSQSSGVLCACLQHICKQKKEWEIFIHALSTLYQCVKTFSCCKIFWRK